MSVSGGEFQARARACLRRLGAQPGVTVGARPRQQAGPRVTLAGYVERVKGLRLDPWQADLCARIEKSFWLARAARFGFTPVTDGGVEYVEAPSGLLIPRQEFEEGKGHGTRAAIHAPPQFGKSVIISQAYPAWILGYDSTHRFRLATYNIFHSARFSVVIKNLINSPEHKSLFPGPEGHVWPRSKAVEWSTSARLEVNDGQASFTALGLASGFTGTGADTLLMDDPYKSVEEALSEIIRDKTWRFYTDTAVPRLDEASNVFIMFHRYHQDDMGGRAVATGEFDLWRYAAVADGDYTDEETGRAFPDPMGRQVGECLSPRKPAAYYERQRRNEQVWNSQFQGRPVSGSGAMFDASKFEFVHESDVPALVAQVRAWDNAATEESEGGSAYTAGVRTGADEAGCFYLLDVVRERVGTAEREALQLRTAGADGRLVAVRAPQDPGSAGKDVAFKFRQMLRGFQVETEPVTGSKVSRAHNYSIEVNRGRYRVVCRDRDGDGRPLPPAWFKAFRDEHHYFPLSTTKDMVDAAADAHRHLSSILFRGLVVKGYRPSSHLVTYEQFGQRFGGKVPSHWDVVAAVSIAPDSSRPSAWAITARAAENAYLGEAVFVVASARKFARDAEDVLSQLRATLDATCEGGASQVSRAWLSKESADVRAVSGDRVGMTLEEFGEGLTAGIAETNWYFQERPAERHPFTGAKGAPGAYLLVAGDQWDEPADERGQLSARQELVSWSYNERGEPQPFGGPVLNCVRMCLYEFALSASPLTRDERREAALREKGLAWEQVQATLGTDQFVDNYWARLHAEKELRREEEEGGREGRRGDARVSFLRGPVRRKKYHG